MADAILDLAELERSSAPLPLPGHLQGYDLAGCLETLAPLIEKARTRVLECARRLAGSFLSVPFEAETIEAALAVNLPEDLLRMIGRVMVLELHVARHEGLLTGETPRERFLSFVRHMRNPEVAQALFEEYPVLIDQVENRINQWAAFSLEFLERLCADWAAIRSTFFSSDPGRLIAVDGGAGDRHKNGRSVLILSFSEGARLVYKPRSIAVETHFQDLLAWVNRRNAGPGFRSLTGLDGGSYGWVEFIRPESCESQAEVSRFYWRQGGFLALLYALEASDFHCENLIAAGGHPVPVDLEALFHPRLIEPGSNSSEYVAGSTLGYSVLRVGLLPVRNWGDEENAGVDLSGLGSAAGQLTPRGVPQWEGVGTDEMHLVRKRLQMGGAENRPKWNGAEVNAFEYTGEIEAGFASTYRTILDHREEFLAQLAHLAGDEVRVIVRPTQTYGTILRESFHPDVLRDEKDRDELFRRLDTLPQDFPSLSRLAASERADLWKGDIPLFATRPSSRDLWTSSGEQLANFFKEPGMELVLRRIRQLSEHDLQRQLWIVRASLGTLAAKMPPSSPPQRRVALPSTAIGRQPLTAAACAIGDRLEDLAIHGDGDASWIGFLPAGTNNWQLAPLSLDLYDGIPGVALFLAYLGAVTGVDRYGKLARAALQTLRWQLERAGDLESIGGFHGWGGAIYTLTHLASLWADANLFAEAEALVERVPDLAARDKELDVIGGSAGCILALTALGRCRPSGRALSAALLCGEHLLTTARAAEQGIGWTNEVFPTPLTGFAHGNAGMAYALFELACLSGDNRFRQAAHDAMEYERSHFSRDASNWADLRESRSTDHALAWCHGAPGIGLGRLLSLRHQDDPQMREEIRVALDTTFANGFGSNHSLCHGDLGNLELLFESGRLLHGQNEWQTRAGRIMAGILESQSQSGWICGNPIAIESPGLMTGLAGIGYELLRFAARDQVPSVLVLAPPVSHDPSN